MLPGGPGFPEQFRSGLAKFFDGRRQIAHREADHRSRAEVFLARVLRAEDLDVAASPACSHAELSTSGARFEHTCEHA
jgi:hypothetical protein